MIYPANPSPPALRLLLLALLPAAALVCPAQSASPAATANPPGDTAPIGRTSAQELQVSGDVKLRNGEMQLGNGSTVTAGANTIPITLTRGGDLRLCATTSVHLARDRSIKAPDASGLLLALDRGAIEAHYTTSKYSDVLLTPDLRILISGPGVADLSIRVSRQGDTCIDNRGANAPYITVTSQFDDGVYRVQPGQHVSFQHGNLREVVDTEKEPCGCPAPPLSVASAGTTAAPGAAVAAPGKAVATMPAKAGAPVVGAASSKADTEFPLAVSEGLTPPTIEPTAPVAAPGIAHLQVAVPFSYHANAPTNPDTAGSGAIPAASPAAPAPVPQNMHNAAAPPAPAVTPRPAPVPAARPVPATPVIAQPAPVRAKAQAPARPRNLFRRVGHFFAKVFGAESQS